MDIIIVNISAQGRNVWATKALSRKTWGMHIVIRQRKKLYRGPYVKEQAKMRAITEPHTWNWQDSLEELSGFLSRNSKPNWHDYDHEAFYVMVNSIDYGSIYK